MAAGSQGDTIDGSGGSRSNDRKRIATRANSFHLANAFENTRLIGAAGTPARHYQTECVVHGNLLRQDWFARIVSILGGSARPSLHLRPKSGTIVSRFGPTISILAAIGLP